MTGTTAMVTEALLYCRVSSEHQRDGVSLEGQLQETRQYAARMGFMLGKEYVDIASGKRDDRPQYQAMLADVRRLTVERKRVAVVVWRLDRLGRRLLERVQRRQELKQLGVGTHSVMENGEVSDVLANVMAALAEEEVRTLGERVKGARRQIRERGWRPIGKVPFGYVLRDATASERADGAPRRVLMVSDPAAALVREAYQRVAAGRSIRSTSQWLAGLASEDRGHRLWTTQTLRQVLCAPVYVARNERADGGDPLDSPVGKWAPIIPDDLYQTVRDEVARHRVLAKQTTNRYLLSGFARCPRCAHKLVGWRATGKQVRYVCDGARCNGTANGPSLEADVLAQVRKVLDVARIDGPLKHALQVEWDQLRGGGREKAGERHLRETDLRATVDQGKQRLARAATMLVDGILDRAGYDAMREQVEADVHAATEKLDRIGAVAVQATPLPRLDEALRRLTDWDVVLSGSDVHGSRRVLAELVEKIISVRVARGRCEAVITWTPLGEALRATAATVMAAA